MTKFKIRKPEAKVEEVEFWLDLDADGVVTLYGSSGGVTCPILSIAEEGVLDLWYDVKLPGIKTNEDGTMKTWGQLEAADGN